MRSNVYLKNCMILSLKQRKIKFKLRITWTTTFHVFFPDLRSLIFSTVVNSVVR